MLRRSELENLRKNGVLWQGITKRGQSDASIEEACRRGLVMRNPRGEGYVITQSGIDYLNSTSLPRKCPTCGQPIIAKEQTP